MDGIQTGVFICTLICICVHRTLSENISKYIKSKWFWNVFLVSWWIVLTILSAGKLRGRICKNIHLQVVNGTVFKRRSSEKDELQLEERLCTGYSLLLQGLKEICCLCVYIYFIVLRPLNHFTSVIITLKKMLDVSPD